MTVKFTYKGIQYTVETYQEAIALCSTIDNPPHNPEDDFKAKLLSIATAVSAT
jgi:hypothetical protein